MLNTYILQIYAPMFYIGTYYRNLRKALMGVEQIFELMSVNKVIHETTTPVQRRITEGNIEFKNVSFSYEDDYNSIIIDNLSFSVPAGTSLGIIGPTGSGKSTILKLLYRFYDVMEGHILIDGVDIRNFKIKELRDNVSIVPQDTVLFNDTIYYNMVISILNLLFYRAILSATRIN